MLLAAASVTCFHCVDYRVVNGSEQVTEFVQSITGTVCPLCGTRTDGFYLCTDRQEMQNVQDGAKGWNSRPVPGFTTRTSPAPGSTSPVAERLRGQVSAQSRQRKKEQCRIITDVIRGNVSLQVGLEALEAGQLAEAERAFRVCADTVEDERFRAAYELGRIAEQDGDAADAARWYARAAGTADPNLRSGATFYLGIVQRQAGDPEAAKISFQQCIDCGISTLQGMAAFRIGTIHHEQGDRAGARRSFEYALDLGHPTSAPDAAVNLGGLEEDDGNWRRARTLWEYAHTRGGPKTVAFAAFNLGRYWDHRRRTGKARTFYGEAARAAEPEIAARARAALGSL